MDPRICIASAVSLLFSLGPWNLFSTAGAPDPSVEQTVEQTAEQRVEQTFERTAVVLPGPAQAATSDGRVGVVVDRQGNALVRPVARERWSPLAQRSVLMPGDLVRTSTRGAHALEVRLAEGGTLILGPGTLVEIPSGGAVRLLRGELSVVGTAAKPVAVTGPGGFSEKTGGGTLLARVEKGRVERLAAPPKWLTGYRNSTTDEWVGSLLAKVDGRDVPLAVGYHKVDAVIRDQIAQTTVEQSFINSTKERLEGVFYFPLPADASISGFGMWIGNELVEADIVEKQRARQIFEDIMRRKKDPGLLEWSGGNLFKARVFPIEPMSEKRIRIRYTQVLPLEGSTVRYRYGLRSELLRKRPLRSLAITVSVASAAKIKSASSTTHPVRTRQTDHAAKLEFDAEDHTPERDFEATITLAKRPPLQVVSHRRGEDGYFMMLLAPPGPKAETWQRTLIPDGEPLDLLLVADTSASMDPDNRRVQREFLTALLGMLTKKDSFRLMTTDQVVRNFTVDPSPVTEQSVESAMTFLANRDSLGWTDLDRMLSEVRRQSRPNTVVVYVGDGIGTKGDPDPVALAQRLKRAGKNFRGVAHAVSTGSTYERPVLESLATLGGGSVRRGDNDPLQAAFGLLNEVAQPAVKNLQISCEGIRTARVYPEAPANLPVGHQQVILGRFLPTGADQAGQVVVTGTLAGKPVRYVAPIQVRAGEQGNSFLPRLWARRHLDALLSQGRSGAIVEDIVAFSEEYGIMTPYTSFLVLESDADRKRYGVERRVSMRDGNQFFAAGRDAATTEILRQQLRVARTYRLKLKMRMLAEIKALGRDLHDQIVAVGEEDQSRSVGRLGGEEFEGKGLVRGAKDEFFMGGSRGLSDPGSPMPESAAAAPMEFDGRFEPSASRDSNLMLLTAEKRVRKVSESKAKSVRRRGGRGGFDRRRSDLGRRIVSQSSSSLTYEDLGFPLLGPPRQEPVNPARAAWPKEILELVGSLDRRSRMRTAPSGFEFNLAIETMHEVQGRPVSFQVLDGLYGSGSWFHRSRRLNSQPTVSWVLDGKRGVVAEALRLGRQRPAAPADSAFQFQLFDLSMTDFARSYATFAAALRPLQGGLVRLTLSAPAPRRERMEFDVDPQRRVVVAYRSVGVRGLRQETVMSDFVEVGGMHFARQALVKNDRGQATSRRRLKVSAVPMATVTRRIREARSKRSDAVLLGAATPALSDARRAMQLGKANFADRLRVALYYAKTSQWEAAWKRFEPVLKSIQNESARRSLRLYLMSQSRRGERFRQALPEGVAALEKRDGRLVVDFLAKRIRRMAALVLSSQEQLDLFLSLQAKMSRPVAAEAASWERVAARARAERNLELHGSLLHTVGRPDEASVVRAAGARRYPDSFALAYAVLSDVQQTGDLRRAAALAESLVAKKGLWRRAEQSSFHQSWFQMLFLLRDLPGMDRSARSWVAADPTNREAYERQLAAMLYRDQGAAVDAWVTRALAMDPTDPAQAAQMEAAVRESFGIGFQRYRQRLQPRRRAPLALFVRRMLAIDNDVAQALARSVLASSPFRSTDEYGALVAELRKNLVGNLASMSLTRLMGTVNVLRWGPKDVGDESSAKVCAALRTRFDASSEPETRDILAGLLLKVFDARKAQESSLAFLRHWLAGAKGLSHEVAANLFGRLLKATWTQAREDELIGLVPQLVTPGSTAERRVLAQATRIRQLADKLVGLRVRATLGPVSELEKLPRQERRLRETRADARARGALATAFGVAANAAALPVRLWWQVESLSFQVESGRDRAAQVAAAQKLLDAVPARPREDSALYASLRERCSLVLSYAASQKGVAATVTGSALAALQAKLRDQKKSLDWRYQIFRLAVATDRNQELEGWLRAWMQPDSVKTEASRIALAYLLAERGDLAAATKAFEAADKLDVLRPTDYANLANWYLVLGDDPARLRALDRQLEVSSESELAVVLNRISAASTRKGGGTAVMTDRDVLVLRTLLRKARNPENYSWRLQRAYRGSKDFRILSCLPFGVLGHSAGSTYDFLRSSNRFFTGVFEEATCDSLMQGIEEARKIAQSDVGRRALHLLTAQVERRAARGLNAREQHIQAALQALQAAAQGKWESGERVSMAQYLAGLGSLKDGRLTAEQLKQLGDLFASEKDAMRGLSIASHAAQCLTRYGHKDQAADLLEAALRAARKATGARLPRAADGVVRRYVRHLQGMGRYRRGESVLLAERTRQPAGERQEHYDRLLDGLYVECVRRGGEVSLGAGEVLFGAVRLRLLDRMWKGTGRTLDYVLGPFLTLHRVADTAGIASAKAQLRNFATKSLPELAPRFLLDQGRRINQVASMVQKVSGATAGLQVFVEALEREPAWLRPSDREYWRAFSWSLPRTRKKALDAALDARLKPFALAALREDLATGSWRSRGLFFHDHRDYWSAADGDFTKVAKEFAAAQRSSQGDSLFVARYMWNGLGERGAAVDCLTELLRRGTLGEPGRWQLATWNVKLSFHDRAIPLLRRLVTERPDRLDYRLELVDAYFGSGSREDALALLTESAKRWQDKSAWSGAMIARFAQTAFAGNAFELAVKYYTEAVRAHERSGSRRWNWRRVRSGYYGSLAKAQAKLGDTMGAVESASSAVVILGESQRERKAAMSAMHRVVAGAKDLPALIRQWDAKVQASGMDAPLMRKQFGQVFLEQGDAKSAVAQLLLARDLQPLDDEIHTRLVQAYDRLGDTDGVIAALHRSIELSPMNLDLYGMLAARYQKAGQTAAAARAYTSMVEVKPNEADSHARLAAVMDRQKRFADAAVQWSQVVRVRRDEPGGWLGLARSQMQAGALKAADTAIQHVLQTKWEARFKNARSDAEKLQQELQNVRKR